MDSQWAYLVHVEQDFRKILNLILYILYICSICTTWSSCEGLAEMTRLVVKKGGKASTITGLAGRDGKGARIGIDMA